MREITKEEGIAWIVICFLLVGVLVIGGFGVKFENENFKLRSDLESCKQDNLVLQPENKSHELIQKITINREDINWVVK